MCQSPSAAGCKAPLHDVQYPCWRSKEHTNRNVCPSFRGSVCYICSIGLATFSAKSRPATMEVHKTNTSDILGSDLFWPFCNFLFIYLFSIFSYNSNFSNDQAAMLNLFLIFLCSKHNFYIHSSNKQLFCLKWNIHVSSIMISYRETDLAWQQSPWKGRYRMQCRGVQTRNDKRQIKKRLRCKTC